jgi:hypothetical protein
MNLEAFKSKLASLTPLGFTVCFHSTAVFPTPSATSEQKYEMWNYTHKLWIYQKYL